MEIDHRVEHGGQGIRVVVDLVGEPAEAGGPGPMLLGGGDVTPPIGGQGTGLGVQCRRVEGWCAQGHDGNLLKVHEECQCGPMDPVDAREGEGT